MCSLYYNTITFNMSNKTVYNLEQELVKKFNLPSQWADYDDDLDAIYMEKVHPLIMNSLGLSCQIKNNILVSQNKQKHNVTKTTRHTNPFELLSTWFFLSSSSIRFLTSSSIFLSVKSAFFILVVSLVCAYSNVSAHVHPCPCIVDVQPRQYVFGLWYLWSEIRFIFCVFVILDVPS